jgi:hypothetical protein
LRLKSRDSENWAFLSPSENGTIRYFRPLRPGSTFTVPQASTLPLQSIYLGARGTELRSPSKRAQRPVKKIASAPVVDDCTREYPAIEVDTSLGGLRVRCALDRIASERGFARSHCVG